jgi:hypothetical protein
VNETKNQKIRKSWSSKNQKVPGYNAREANANAVKILYIESRVLTRLTIKKNEKC